MSVSVIIPSYNCGQFVAATVASALAQSCVPDEVIIVDDGSSDDTSAVLQEFSGRVVLERQANAGVASARNRGMDLARGEWLMFLDADDLLEPIALEKLLSIATTDCGVVYGHTTEIDVEGNTLGEVRSRNCQGPIPSAARENFDGSALRSPGCAIVRAELAREIRFDQRCAPCEDRDFWFRCGTRAEFVEAALPVLRYRIRPGSHSSDLRKQKLQSVVTRLLALEWFEAEAIVQPMTPLEVVESSLLQAFWGREWPVVEDVLKLARERGFQSRRIEEVRWRRHMPRWISPGKID